MPLPAEWVDAQRLALGVEAGSLFAALDLEPLTSVRLNPAKPIPVGGDPVPWCAHGRHLARRPVFTLDPLFHAGCYYVQEASSMFLEQAVHATGLQHAPVLALDLCAAPGGKSTHLLSLLDPCSLVVCNEALVERQATLLENLWKWGAANAVVTAEPGSAFSELEGLFDLVLLDAPCSGEGMFRKDHFARQQWSTALVQRCAATQRELLACAWRALKPGGSLIYSTCTWEPSENEAHVERMIAQLDALIVPIPVVDHWNIENTGGGWRFMPHRVAGEGFFITVLRKPGTLDQRAPFDPTERIELPLGALQCSVPKEWARFVDSLQRSIRVLSAGTPRSVAGKGPHIAACFPADTQHRDLDTLDLDAKESLRYLRGEALPAASAAGYRHVMHEGFGIGLVKGAGNRWNNLHPKAWRIRMQLPGTPVTLR